MATIRFTVRFIVDDDFDVDAIQDTINAAVAKVGDLLESEFQVEATA